MMASQDCQCWSHGACPVPTRVGINEEFIICIFQGRKALWWFVRSYVEPLGPIWVLLGQGLLGWGGWVPAAQALPRPSHFRGAKFQSLCFHTTFQGPAKV